MLSTTAEYALRIMTVLAESSGLPVTSERIASLTNVPPDYSVKVLQMLAKANLVRAQRGRGGGFRIAADPAGTTLLDVVNAIDPPHHPQRPPSEHRHLVPLYRRLSEMTDMLQARLRQATLRQLVDEAQSDDAAMPPSITVTGVASRRPKPA